MVSQEFKASVADKNLLRTRIMLKDSFVVDPTFVQKVAIFLQFPLNSVLAFTADFSDDFSGVGQIGPKSQEVDSLG